MDAFIGEIRAFPYGFIPQGWLCCDGISYQVTKYQVLASVIGKLYGGSSDQFAVPDLRGRVAVGLGVDFQRVGLTGGTEKVKLDYSKLPIHNHGVSAYIHSKDQVNLISNTPGSEYYLTNGTTKIPAAGGNPLSVSSYSPTISYVDIPYLNDASVGMTGGTTPESTVHENRQPFLAFQYCICYESDYYPIRP